MRAAWYEKNGPAAEVLHLGEIETPKPGPGEVRVKLKTSGVNPSDVKTRAGTARKIAFPRVIPQSDGAGEIDMVGEGVAPSRVGERVWTWNAQWKRPFGTAAEYIVLPANQAVRLPDAISFEAGACFGIPALTAWHAIDLAGTGSGSTLLIAGGAGAVAHYAIQFAKARGATVITTVSSAAKAKLARDAGADHTIDYKTENVGERVMALTKRRRRRGDRTGPDGERRAAAGRAAATRHACRLRHRPAGAVPRLVLPREQHHGEISAGVRTHRRRAHARHRRHHPHAGGERAQAQSWRRAFPLGEHRRKAHEAVESGKVARERGDRHSHGSQRRWLSATCPPASRTR